ncbi:protein disulfide isomerase CRELD2-like [Ruditapes philippinarum]|uniref:protein disulfide isomerase CRELD2-like n=1 Tax=Ruditapes philippinarum TaxID=129788 RepID=UPI00295B4BD0|nr:protein disulfide isomerase CRELD2-like [Ruditapes philippinarum]
MECSCLTIIVGIVLLHISKAALPTGCSGGTQTCPANSACTADGTDTCVCNDGFKLNSAQDGCEAKVLGDVCDSTNGCTGLSNIACTNSKCECAAGYANKNSVCTKVRVSEVVCKAAGTECDSIDHAGCEIQKCKCNTGYIEDTKDGSTCVKIIGGSCQGTAACPGDQNTICKNSLCVCTDDYVEKANVCKKRVDRTICSVKGTECSSTDNADCDTTALKCKCNDGFKMNADTCIAAEKNAGVSATLAFIVLALLPVILSIKEAIM